MEVMLNICIVYDYDPEARYLYENRNFRAVPRKGEEVYFTMIDRSVPQREGELIVRNAVSGIVERVLHVGGQAIDGSDTNVQIFLENVVISEVKGPIES